LSTGASATGANLSFRKGQAYAFGEAFKAFRRELPSGRR
jgi:hypothetical protein